MWWMPLILSDQASDIVSSLVGLDLSQYTAIDVSLQPMDGSPMHSSVSAVRGIMKT